jgi:hypothetical protein
LAPERRIDEYGAARAKHDTSAAEHLGVDLLGEFGVVGALPGSFVHGLGGPDADHLLACSVGVDHRCAHLQAESAADRALAARDDAAHRHDTGPEQRASTGGQREHEASPGRGLSAGALSRADRGIVGDERRDLAAHKRSIALVEIQDPVEVKVSAGLGVLGHQVLAQLDVPVRAEIHREEGEVGCDIGVAESVVELDAVQHRDRAVLPQIDVLQPQVTVSVSHPTGRDACIESLGFVLEQGELVLGQFAHLILAEVAVQRGLSEVLPHVGGDGVGGAER